MSILHYIFDPLCGWCYAAAPLIDAALGVPGVRIALHAGGMLIGPSRQTVTQEWSDYIRVNDERIAQISAQRFGSAYLEGLLGEEGLVLDSEPPITAILAAQCLAGRGGDMLRRLQQAHFIEGRHIAETSVICSLADELGFAVPLFVSTFERLQGLPTKRHIRDSRQLLERAGGEGFPTLLIEGVEGILSPVNIGFWLGRPTAFRKDLIDQLGVARMPSASLLDAVENSIPGD